MVDADTFTSFTFERVETRSAIQELLDQTVTEVELNRIDVVLSDGSLLTWVDGAFVS